MYYSEKATSPTDFEKSTVMFLCNLFVSKLNVGAGEIPREFKIAHIQRTTLSTLVIPLDKIQLISQILLLKIKYRFINYT